MELFIVGGSAPSIARRGGFFFGVCLSFGAVCLLFLLLAYFQKPETLAFLIKDQIALFKITGSLSNQREVDLDMVDAFTLARTARAERLYEPIVIDAAQNYDVQPSLIKAVIMAESTFDHRAVSHRGAQGLMQLMPGTAKDLGVEDSFNPAHNIFGGVKYLKQLIERFEGNAELALAAYNAGLQKVLMYKGVPPFQSTRAYIKKVQQYQKYYQWKMAGRIEQA